MILFLKRINILLALILLSLALGIVKFKNNLPNQKISNFDENIKEDEAEKLKGELEQIESYLLSQYKDYVDLDEKDIDLDSFKEDLDIKE